MMKFHVTQMSARRNRGEMTEQQETAQRARPPFSGQPARRAAQDASRTVIDEAV
ncbi:hypothetical protein [Escherichia coli]|uniref:hypothetical protein n=1 Tax=Escherichia coli TaxID=562 RepID=UPI0015EB5FB4|nr:hypothetical protein [Escherichia coli]